MSIRSFLAQNTKRLLEQYSKKRLSQYPEVAQILARSSPSTGCDYTDYWSLYSYIKKYKPREVLELGSGISTALIALAIKENGIGRLTSMEESEEYYRSTERILPDNLKPYIDLRFSPVVEDQYGPFRGVRYKEIPERAYDLVLVDGPQYDASNSFDLDLLRILGKSESPINAFVDSRTGSCFVYHLVLGSKFKFSYLRRLGVVSAATKYDLKSYKEIVAASMKKRQFSRTW